MATYVSITKTTSNDDFVEYSFGPNDSSRGLLRIHRATGAIEVLDEVPGDDTKLYSIRASRKVAQHFKKHEFPDVTCFAS